MMNTVRTMMAVTACALAIGSGEAQTIIDNNNGNVVGQLYYPRRNYEGPQIDDPMPVQKYSAPSSNFDRKALKEATGQ